MKYSYSKRCVDLFVSLSLCLIFLPVMFFVALIILVLDGWPVIFSHERAGLSGKVFTLYKFRTMKLFSHEQKEERDAIRVTPLGYWLRKTSFDELPQLWNVIRGDMSLVGPRPLPTVYVDRYNDEQKQRLTVMPGITGWAQINGRNALSWNEKFTLDVWYVNHASCWLDVKILFLTVFNVMLLRGIVHDSATSDITMPEFLGEKSSSKDRKVKNA